jgi:hypothetical protein
MALRMTVQNRSEAAGVKAISRCWDAACHAYGIPWPCGNAPSTFVSALPLAPRNHAPEYGEHRPRA